MRHAWGLLGILWLQAGCALAQPAIPGGASVPSRASGSTRLQAVSTVTVEQARKRLDADATLRLIDVRNPDEFAENHISRADLLPLGELEAWAPTLDPKKPLVLICRSGRRSGVAADALARKGFASIVSVEGGMLAWESAGFPVVRP